MKASDYLNPKLEPGIYKVECANANIYSPTDGSPDKLLITWRDVDGTGEVTDSIRLEQSWGRKMARIYLASGGDPEQELPDTVAELAEFLLEFLPNKQVVIQAEQKGDYVNITRYWDLEEGQVILDQEPAEEINF